MQRLAEASDLRLFRAFCYAKISSADIMVPSAGLRFTKMPNFFFIFINLKTYVNLI